MCMVVPPLRPMSWRQNGHFVHTVCGDGARGRSHPISTTSLPSPLLGSIAWKRDNFRWEVPPVTATDQPFCGHSGMTCSTCTCTHNTNKYTCIIYHEAGPRNDSLQIDCKFANRAGGILPSLCRPTKVRTLLSYFTHGLLLSEGGKVPGDLRIDC